MSKQRKLRSKLSFDEDEAGDAPPPPPPAASKKESSKPKKSSLLSFGDDEEASLSSSKPKKDKAKVSKFHRANVSSSAGDAAAAAAAPTRPSAGEPTLPVAVIQLSTTQRSCEYKGKNCCTHEVHDLLVRCCLCMRHVASVAARALLLHVADQLMPAAPDTACCITAAKDTKQL
jgi:hypothetical protein